MVARCLLDLIKAYSHVHLRKFGGKSACQLHQKKVRYLLMIKAAAMIRAPSSVDVRQTVVPVT